MVNWAKSSVRKRTINKRQRTTGKKQLLGGSERQATSFSQKYTGSGAMQLAGAQGLRERMLREGKIAPKKHMELGRLGRTTAVRQTPKWEEDWSALKQLSCRRALELCLRASVPRFYDLQGKRGDWSAALRYLEQSAK